MTNPYASPKSVLIKPASQNAWFLDALTFGVPALLCALHVLAFLDVISLLAVDVAIGRDSPLQEVMLRPLVVMQPLCTLSAALLLLWRRRLALFAAGAFPCAILAYSLYYDIELSMLYFVCACFLTVYVGLLAVLRKLV
ncbi:MAG: hypothetical protein ACOY82_20285 [Pseudomonadota bacterium]